MNILIANSELENFFGGTQTWTTTMRKAFMKLGHKVNLYSSNGKYHKHFEKFTTVVQDKYDLIICNGNLTLQKLYWVTGPKAFISHGVLPSLEQPVAGADYYFAVSEEVADNCSRRGFPVKCILRNPIDIDEFPFLGCSDELKNITFLDRRRRFPFIDNLSKYHIEQVGNPPVYNMATALAAADLVVARGRGIYEAMSLGKNVIVSGNNSGRGRKVETMDGYVTDASFFEFRKNNCSGRRHGYVVHSPLIFINEAEKYDPEQGLKNRKIIESENHYVKIAEQLLESL